MALKPVYETTDWLIHKYSIGLFLGAETRLGLCHKRPTAWLIAWLSGETVCPPNWPDAWSSTGWTRECDCQGSTFTSELVSTNQEKVWTAENPPSCADNDGRGWTASPVSWAHEYTVWTFCQESTSNCEDSTSALQLLSTRAVIWPRGKSSNEQQKWTAENRRSYTDKLWRHWRADFNILLSLSLLLSPQHRCRPDGRSCNKGRTSSSLLMSSRTISFVPWYQQRKNVWVSSYVLSNCRLVYLQA